MSNKTFDFSSKKRIFCPKTSKFGPKLAFLFIADSFGALLVGWLVVVARAVSRKTPIYFIDIVADVKVSAVEILGVSLVTVESLATACHQRFHR